MVTSVRVAFVTLFVTVVVSLSFAWWNHAVTEQRAAEMRAESERSKEARAKQIQDIFKQWTVLYMELVNLGSAGSAAEMAELGNRMNQWASETRVWIAENAGDAAATRFKDGVPTVDIALEANETNARHRLLRDLDLALSKYSKKLIKFIA